MALGPLCEESDEAARKSLAPRSENMSRLKPWKLILPSRPWAESISSTSLSLY